jgi:hypothetical protein
VKKIGLIMIALVLALGTLGVAYAHWSQTLTIYEEVNTGNLEVGIRDIGTNDPGPALTEEYGMVHPDSSDNGTLDPGYEKNVAAAYSVNGVFKFTKDGVDYFHDVTETIVNAYPSYSATIFLEFANNGTVPVKAEEVVIIPGNLDEFVEVTGWEIRDAGGVYASGVGLAALAAALQGYQLDPCNTVEVDITKHVIQFVDADGDGEQDPDEVLPMNATITLSETVKWTQWNMVQ